MQRKLNKQERAVINRRLHALAAQVVYAERENLYQFYEANLESEADAVELIEAHLERVEMDLTIPPLVTHTKKEMPF